MAAQVPQMLLKTLLIVVIAAIACANARPNHFGDANQVVSEPEGQNLLNSDLKPWELQLIVQRLSEMQNPASANDFGWERGIRSPENKRQSRFRQCYFNPISCFKK